MLLFKQLIIVTLALFTITDVNAQECKYTVEEKDKFTNKITKELEPVLLTKKVKMTPGAITNVKMTLKLENGKKLFIFSFVRSSSNGPVLVKGNQLILLLKNGEQITLTMTQMTSDMNKYVMSSPFEISDKQLALLEQHDISDIRVLPTFNPVDILVDAKKGTAKYFHCIK
ncbi:MAG: hypothetical protein GY810_31320 [Aureispira sp.]|nr:hypothetical protein [Aureispira sp.]